MTALGLDLDSVVDACRAYEPLLRDGEAFSHHTAAMLFGAPLPPGLASVRPLHVVSPGVTRARSDGVVGHRSRGGFAIVLRFGLPVVAPETMWMQLAAQVGREDLTAIGDFLVTGAVHGRARELALTTLPRLVSMTEGNAGGRGARGARWALERVRIGAASRTETLLRLVIIAAGLPEPSIGVPVPVGNGSLVLHPDLAYADLRIAIEYEGGHHRDTARWERDIERRELFEDAGWRVIRVTRHALFEEPDALIERIRRVRQVRSAS